MEWIAIFSCSGGLPLQLHKTIVRTLNGLLVSFVVANGLPLQLQILIRSHLRSRRKSNRNNSQQANPPTSPLTLSPVHTHTYTCTCTYTPSPQADKQTNTSTGAHIWHFWLQAQAQLIRSVYPISWLRHDGFADFAVVQPRA